MSFDFAEYRKQKAERLARGEKKNHDAPAEAAVAVPAPAEPAAPVELSPAAPVLETTKVDEQ